MNRVLQTAQAGFIAYFISQQSSAGGAANTYIASLSTIWRAIARTGPGYFTPKIKGYFTPEGNIRTQNPNNSSLRCLFQQAMLIQMMNASLSTAGITSFLMIYQKTGKPEISDLLIDYYKISLINIPVFSVQSLMNNVLVGSGSKNWVPALSLIALIMQLSAFEALKQFDALSITTIPAATLSVDVFITLLQIIIVSRKKMLPNLFSREPFSTLKPGLIDNTKKVAWMNLPTVLEISMSMINAIFAEKIDLIHETLWNIASTLFGLFYALGLDISMTLATIIGGYSTNKEKWMCYTVCKLQGLSIAALMTGLIFSPLQEKILLFFMPKELSYIQEEYHSEIQKLLTLTSLLCFTELQLNITKGALRGIDSNQTRWISNATLGALYILQLPILIIITFLSKINLALIAGIWLGTTTLLETAFEVKTVKKLSSPPAASLVCHDSFFYSERQTKTEASLSTETMALSPNAGNPN